MIWTEQEDQDRQFMNIINPKDKKCMNCQWSNAEPSEEMTTCGHHIQNFSVDSFCGYWTDPNDPKLIAYRNLKKAELKAKLK